MTESGWFADPVARYDRLVLAVFELESGQHVAWYSLQPNDSPKDVVKARQDSRGTVIARK